jgi:dienelactone hydrolase
MRRLLIALLLATTLAALGTAWLLRDPMPHFRERRSALASVAEGADTVIGAYRLRTVRLEATSGLAVDLTIRRALVDGERRLPVVVILGGHHTGQDAVKLIGDSRGTLVAALSYPFTGDPRPDAATFLREIPKIRAAFLDTPPAVMLALDYLLQRDDADVRQVEAVGVSLGAPFMCVAGALDERFTRVWALHGSGGSYEPLEMNMRRTIRLAPVRIPAAAIANVIIAGPRLAPERWVPRIAPRPFVMVNASGDERLPRASVERLYTAARQPKELVWMAGEHVHADTATVRRLSDIVLARVRATADSLGAGAIARMH